MELTDGNDQHDSSHRNEQTCLQNSKGLMVQISNRYRAQLALK